MGEKEEKKLQKIKKAEEKKAKEELEKRQKQEKKDKKAAEKKEKEEKEAAAKKEKKEQKAKEAEKKKAEEIAKKQAKKDKKKQKGKPSLISQSESPSQTLSEEDRQSLTEEYQSYIHGVENLSQREDKHAFPDDIRIAKEQKEKLDKKSLKDPKLSSLSSTLGDKIKDAEPSVNAAVGAKEELVTNVKENPLVTNMILHVGEVGHDNRVRANKNAKAQLEAEENRHGPITDKQERRKRLFELQMRERRKGQDPETPEETAKREKEERIDNAGEKSKGFFEKIIDVYNGIVGNQSDIMDTTSLSDIQTDLVENYSKLSGAASFDPGVSDYLGAAGAYLSIINVTIDMLKNFAEGLDNQGLEDSQEKSLKRRIFITNVVSLVSSTIDYFAMFTNMVPFLGAILNLAQDGMDMGVALMERANTHKRKGQIKNAKERLSNRLEQKRQEHKNDGMKELFVVDISKDKNIYKKRNELMAIISQTDGTRADINVDEHSVYKPRNFVTKAMNKVDTFFHRKDREVLDQGYGEVNERLSRNEAKLQRKEAAGNELTLSDKISMAQLEALEILNEYQVLNASEHRMNVKKRGEVEDLVKASIKIASDGLVLAGQITTATGVAAPVGAGLILAGKIGKAGVGIVNSSELIGGFLNEKFENHSQRGKNKAFQRNEMAVALFERMDMIAKSNRTHGWLDNPDSIAATAKDRDIQRVNNDYGYILSYRQGTDMRVSSILKADSRNDIISSLSDTFSQDGN